ncbi:MAG: YlxM family DNA-binding protein [Clostridiales bacterium]|nr:YlxM family DNA-binding protein [Clostridiales bacterium]
MTPDDKLKMTLLYDFYGDLLTEKQRAFYNLRHNEDFSLAEIAEQAGISRQGVHDIITRAENILIETEKKTGLVRRFTQLQKDIDAALELVSKLKETATDDTSATLLRQLTELLVNMKG